MVDQIKIIRPGAEGLVIQGNATAEIIIGVGKQGPPGVSGVQPMSTANFAYGDATPAAIVTVPAGKRVYALRLFVEVPFDGMGASLSIGSSGNPEELMAAAENNLLEAGVYLVYPDKKYAGATPILLTITPGSGASAGSGQVQIDIEP